MYSNYSKDVQSVGPGPIGPNGPFKSSKMDQSGIFVVTDVNPLGTELSAVSI